MICGYRGFQGSFLGLLSDLVVVTSLSTEVLVLGVVVLDLLGLDLLLLLSNDRKLAKSNHGERQEEDVLEVSSAVGHAVYPGKQEEIDRAEAKQHLNGSRANDSHPDSSGQQPFGFLGNSAAINCSPGFINDEETHKEKAIADVIPMECTRHCEGIDLGHDLGCTLGRAAIHRSDHYVIL